MMRKKLLLGLLLAVLIVAGLFALPAFSSSGLSWGHLRAGACPDADIRPCP
jgi:hypothetical protein